VRDAIFNRPEAHYAGTQQIFGRGENGDRSADMSKKTKLAKKQALPAKLQEMLRAAHAAACSAREHEPGNFGKALPHTQDYNVGSVPLHSKSKRREVVLSLSQGQERGEPRPALSPDGHARVKGVRLRAEWLKPQNLPAYA
jgi:hypothetical protein